MSRNRKHTAQVTKDAPLQEKRLAAQFGDDRHPAAVNFAIEWDNLKLFSLGAKQLRKGGIVVSQAHCNHEVRRLRKLLLTIIESEIENAHSKGDGTFLLGLADAFVRNKGPLVPDRVRIATLAAAFEGNVLPLETFHRQFCESRPRDAEMDISQFRRLCDEIGLRYKRVKPGKKRKPLTLKQKLAWAAKRLESESPSSDAR